MKHSDVDPWGFERGVRKHKLPPQFIATTTTQYTGKEHNSHQAHNNMRGWHGCDCVSQQLLPHLKNKPKKGRAQHVGNPQGCWTHKLLLEPQEGGCVDLVGWAACVRSALGILSAASSAGGVCWHVVKERGLCACNSLSGPQQQPTNIIITAAAACCFDRPCCCQTCCRRLRSRPS